MMNSCCHPCSRVLWNLEVLRQEEEHRQKHIEGTCECNVVFRGVAEERARREAEKAEKGKGKEVAVRGGSDGEGSSQNSDGGVAGGQDTRAPWTQAAHEYTKYRPTSASGDQGAYVPAPAFMGPHASIQNQGQYAFASGSANPTPAESGFTTPIYGNRYVSYDAHGNHRMANLGDLLREISAPSTNPYSHPPYPTTDPSSSSFLPQNPPRHAYEHTAVYQQAYSPVDGYTNQGMVAADYPPVPLSAQQFMQGPGPSAILAQQPDVKFYTHPSNDVAEGGYLATQSTQFGNDLREGKAQATYHSQNQSQNQYYAQGQGQGNTQPQSQTQHGTSKTTGNQRRRPARKTHAERSQGPSTVTTATSDATQSQQQTPTTGAKHENNEEAVEDTDDQEDDVVVVDYEVEEHEHKQELEIPVTTRGRSYTS